MFAPGLLRLGYVAANCFVANEQPCFIEQKSFESGQSGRICDFTAGSVEHIEEERFQQFRCVSPSVEVEGLESPECERVFVVIEEETVLPGPCPTVQAFLQFSDNISEIA